MRFGLPKIYLRPEGDGGTGGGAVDRGDDWTPTDDDAVADTRLGKTADEEAAAAAAAEAAAAEAAAAGLKGKKTEGEGEGEGEGELGADGKPKKPKVDNRVPISRVNEMISKEREASKAERERLEAELAQYRQGTKIADTNAEIAAAETKLTGLEETYAKQLTDGKPGEAAKTMAEIRKLEREITTKTLVFNTQAAEARAVERVRYDMTVDRIEEQYPQLVPGGDNFDKAKTAEVLELKEAYESKGYTPSAALQKAVKLLMPPTTKAQEAAVDVTPRVDAAAVEAARKKAAVEKTAETVAKTPASSAKVGANSDAAGGGAVTAKDAMKMSYKDFAALDEATLAAMRGDVL